LSNRRGAAGESGEYQKIPLDQIEIGESNVRRRDITVDLDGLAYSMDKFGLQHPIIVQPINAISGKYEVVVGQRRYLAAKQLGWERIDTKIKEERLNEFDAKVLSFSENVQRRDLSPRDKSDTCSYLLDQLKSPRKIAEHLGITEQTVRKWLGYALVPEMLKRLVDRKLIKVSVAIRLAQFIPDEAKAIAIAMRIVGAPKTHIDRVLESMEESPESSVEAIFRRAEELKRRKKIIFILPEKWSYAMARAVDQLGMTPNEIARDATIEWLQMTRY